MKLVSSAQMRAIDDYAISDMGISSLTLMENAGNAVFEEIVKKTGNVESKKCIVLCGTGNNGGDGFVISRLLSENGAAVTAILMGSKDNLKTDAFNEYNKLTDKNIIEFFAKDNKIKEVDFDCDIIVDAVYGTGFNGELSLELSEFFSFINNINAFKVAVDLPSGVNCDNGQVSGECIKADMTVTFCLPKLCHFIYPAADYCGRIIVKDIGIPQKAVASQDIKAFLITDTYIDANLTKRRKNSHKGTYGKVLAVCGSKNMTGAAYFAASSAIKTGAGLVTLCVPDSILKVMQVKLNEPIFLSYPDCYDKDFTDNLLDEALNKNDVCLFGCGSGVNYISEMILEKLLTSEKPLVLDADALNILSKNPQLFDNIKIETVLTPHLAEFSRLSGLSIDEINSDKISAVLGFSNKYNVITVLKGAYTIIAVPDGRIYINTTGNPGLSKGGSGDVLSGMIASFIAQKLNPLAAAICAVFLHGKAADIAAKRISEYGMTPTDLLTELPLLFNKYNGE